MPRVLVLIFIAACAGTPTGSSCPTADPPTYDNFGRQFFADYCTGCHSANASNRHGAPTSQNFDSEADIKAHALDIDLQAAAGPKSKNTEMPDLDGPVRMAPSEAQRTMLGQYLACMQQ
jgi:uncharacterized membrane protein